MLKQRILTAIVLLGVLLGVLAAPGVLPLAVFLLLIAVLGLFEWWRMTLAPYSIAQPAPDLTQASVGQKLQSLVLRGSTGWRRALPVFTALLALWLLVRLWLDYAYLGATLIQVLGEGSALFPAGTAEREQVLALVFGRLWLWAIAGWLIASLYLWWARVDAPPFSLLLTAFGLLALPAAGTALFAAFDRGILYLVSLLGLIWAADIAAYFVGRAVGGSKLAPHISPGKTLSGAMGGVLGALLWVGGMVLVSASTGYRTLSADLLLVWGWIGLLFWTIVLALLSIAGDLFESLLKRRAGRKDSSQLLPGHGGVLDRIDAVLPVAPAAMLLVL